MLMVDGDYHFLYFAILREFYKKLIKKIFNVK